MSKKQIEKIATVLPHILKNASSYLKNNFDEKGQETLSNATGTVGVFVRLFAQDTIDAYFEKLTEEKLEDFGSATYLKASLLEVGKSMDVLNEVEIQVPEGHSLTAHLIDILDVDKVTFDPNEVLTIFTPQYHPIVLFVKEQMIKLLQLFNVHSQTIDSFRRNFNDNIEKNIVECFGDDDYEQHKKEIETFMFKEKESKLLYDMYKLRKIGFKESEELRYEETYASWRAVSKVLEKEDNAELNNEEHKELEDKQQPIEELINEYFDSCNTNCLQNILFAITDFGKGKSVFLKQYASRLAKEYAQTKEGYFPIYFNLREFSKYSSEGSLGVLDGFLLDEYGIRINDEEFSKRKYIFLVDSLDESGELTKSKVEAVISSIKNIQNIDKEKRRDNRIIITSRPFSEALQEQLKLHNPYELLNENNEKVAQYISLYGFKEEQFDSWLSHSLKDNEKLNELTTTGSIYQKLLQEKTLSREELRRPIFSYMIYQLILNRVDFLAIGKIGVYLSFINLLTKEAKHIDDTEHNIDQKEEIHYRNILHSIAALWMYERQQGKQGVLKKADICRVLDGENKGESDKKILERYKDDEVTEIEFLSHSYFGEENNELHFQHQSFAEILLAEYYLKVFIKYAIDKKPNIDEARAKLILGEPTEQTIEFFKELLMLLKGSVSSEPTDEVLEKRKLLYPLMATLASDRHNMLYCERIDSKWFEDVEVDNASPTINKELLENWAIGEKELEKIIVLAKDIIDAKTTLLLAKTSTKTALFDHELTVFQNAQVSDSPTDMDKWLALLVGNLLHDDVPEDRDFFNGRLEFPEHLFEMIKGWNYFAHRASSPSWSRQYFKGINYVNYKKWIYLINYKFTDFDFSYSTLGILCMDESHLSRCKFNNCKFSSVLFQNTRFSKTDFSNVEIENRFILNGSIITAVAITTSIFIPNQLVNYFEDSNIDYKNIQKIPTQNKDDLNYFFFTLKGLLVHGLKNNLFDIPEIKSWFDYKTNEDRKEFESLIDGLKDA
ncbi:MAG TPA: NACHT domain-containing protein [Campylobacterales bacterium]|nr:NACHT domain-containing protein [Campylobacterales bacterium]